MIATLLAGLLATATPQAAVFPVVKARLKEVTADDVHARVEAIAARRAGLSIVSRTAFLTTPNEVIRQLGDCALEAECLARAARSFTARYLIVVVANTELDPPLVATLLIDVDEQKLVHRAVGGEPNKPLSARIEEQVDAALDAAAFVRLARLTIQAEPRDSTIEVPGSVRREADGIFWVAPGDIQLDVKRVGYETEHRSIALAPGSTETIDVALSPEASVFASPWLWLGVGAVVAAGIGAAVYATRPGADECACVGDIACPPGC